MSTSPKYKAIVIGASAGGLYALAALLEHLPVNYSIPIIMVQHRIKDQRTLLEEVLQSKAAIKVKQADEKEKIDNSCVYIAPPDYHLLIENDYTFSLSYEEPVSYSRPSIDVLFESAAQVYKAGLIAVILTGANGDGTAGMRIIKANGGLTIAQSPEEALFRMMPERAIEAKVIDHVWTLKQIADFLIKTGEQK